MTFAQLRPINRWLEPLFAAVIVGYFAYIVWFLFTYSYLPPPYFYEPFDLWADWFNTAYWAHDPGTYDSWKTLYPPLSFVFLRIFSLSHCYPIKDGGDPSAGLPARDCDWFGLATLHVFFLLAALLSWLSFRKADPKTAAWRGIAVALGWPLTDALERGNLMLVAYVGVVLAFGPLLKSTRLRWLAIGLAVNFKVYLVASIVPLLAKRKWRFVEGALLSVIAVYVATFAMYGDGTPVEIFTNIRDWNIRFTENPLDLWMQTTYLPMLSLFKDSNWPVVRVLGSQFVEAASIAIPIILRLVQGLIIAALLATLAFHRHVTRHRLVGLGILLALISADSGGYTPGFFIFFVFLERWSNGAFARTAIVLAYFLSIPVDYTLDRAATLVRETYLWGEWVVVDYVVNLAPLMRPGVILLIAAALSVQTLLDAYRGFRETRGRAVPLQPARA